MGTGTPVFGSVSKRHSAKACERDINFLLPLDLVCIRHVDGGHLSVDVWFTVA